MKNTWVELHLDALAANIRSVRRALTPGTEIVFVVKSNAYGHGMADVSACAWRHGVRWFAVAHLDEALELRRLLPEARLLVLGVLGPADVSAALAHEIVPVIVSEKQALALAAAAVAEGKALECHAKIDTGMGRLGFAWENAADVVARLARQTGLEVRGVCTHLASAAAVDTNFAEIQAARFHGVVQACGRHGMGPLFRHISNSGGALRDIGWDMDGVRLGILLYGYGPLIGGDPQGRASGAAQGAAGKVRLTSCRQVETRPFLQWKTRVVQVKRVPARSPVSYDSTYITERETHIATLDAGYADGYSRLLSNRGWVLAGGQRRPVVGRVTMNLSMVDLGPLTEVKEGDEITLLGAEGEAAVWADEIAGLCGTIPYEVLTNIRTDVRRITGG